MSDHEIRELRFKLKQADDRLKQADKTIGRKGHAIHVLRSELAEVRELHHKIERGDIRSLERQVESLTKDLEKARQENKTLREQRKTGKESSE
jgi:chromosome segregation ATPase